MHGIDQGGGIGVFLRTRKKRQKNVRVFGVLFQSKRITTIAVELYVVTINEKPWTHTKEVCKALKYEKVAGRVVRHHFTTENIQYKHQLVVVPTVGKTVHWLRDSQKLDLYINEKGMYELLLSSQQPKTKDFRSHCCNVLFPHVRQQVTNKMKGDHQEVIQKKDAALALLNDDLQNCQYENVSLW